MANNKGKKNKKSTDIDFALGDKSFVESENVSGAAASASEKLGVFDETPDAEEQLAQADVDATEAREAIIEAEENEMSADDIIADISGEEIDEAELLEGVALDAGDEIVEPSNVIHLEPDMNASADTELAAFESAEIEEVEILSESEIASAVESLLFANDKPMSLALLKAAFQGTKVRTAHIRRAIELLQIEYANPLRGVSLEEVAGGYQIRTKIDNQKYLQRTVKARPFRLSGPALEVLAIVAYKQPCTKSMVDEIRGVESGHLMRGLLDRGLLTFGEKSDLPGRPMFYETSRRFLEIFSLRNINELPTLNEIDQLIPEGIGETVEEKPKLSDLTGQLSTEIVAKTYSEGEEELLDIANELQAIQTSSDFFEQEKRRLKDKAEADRAQDIRERLAVGESVEAKDERWLARYELQKQQAAAAALAAESAAAQAAIAAEAPAEAAAEPAGIEEASAAEVSAAETVEIPAETAADDFFAADAEIEATHEAVAADAEAAEIATDETLETAEQNSDMTSEVEGAEDEPPTEAGV